jgi:hypothetical protein
MNPSSKKNKGFLGIISIVHKKFFYYVTNSRISKSSS